MKNGYTVFGFRPALKAQPTKSPWTVREQVGCPSKSWFGDHGRMYVEHKLEDVNRSTQATSIRLIARWKVTYSRLR